MKGKLKLALGIIIVAVAVGLAAGRFWPRPVISGALRQQASFVIFVPGPPYKVSPKTVLYDTQQKTLTYQTVKTAGPPVFQVTEQSEPDLLKDGGQDIYNKFVAQLGGYAAIDTAVGPVSLTKPGKLHNQTAVLDSQGTLVFVRPSADISQDTWQHFFNTWQTVH